MAIKLECCYVETCLPDYWSGHHRPHVAIVVNPGMTIGQIRRDIRDQLRWGAVMGSSDDARLLSADVVHPGEEKRADALTRAAYAAVNRLKAKPVKTPCPCGHGTIEKTPRLFFTDIESPSDDGGDYVYAYFVFMELDA